MSALQRRAVQLAADRLTAAGGSVPDEVTMFLCGATAGSGGAARWAAQHPDDDALCCDSAVLDGPWACQCWVPVFDVDQAPPRPLADPRDLPVQPHMCADCAYRPGSPERSAPGEEEALMDLAHTGDPFYCHEGIRRPTRWHHPDGRQVTADPGDYQPPILAGVPYRADGSPAALCGGWAAVATHTTGGDR